MSVGRDAKRSGHEEGAMEPDTLNQKKGPTSLSRHVSDGSADSVRIGCSQGDLVEENIHSISNSTNNRLPWHRKVSTTTTSAQENKKVVHDFCRDKKSSPSSTRKPQHVFSNDQKQHPLRRISSIEWIKDYKKERIDKINFNNVFGGIGDASHNEIPSLPLPNEPPTHKYFENNHTKSPLTYSINSPSSTATSASTDGAQSISPSISSNNEPDPIDVICGRGGRANNHPGNVSFRDKALKLRSWYESSSKSEKFTISSLLVDFVRERGGRFLRRDGDKPGNWLEVAASDVRKKASQALREGKSK